ncbi:cell cycle control protein [Histomonas meleagridis]|uniref:cell cycle control protein n=1 Tax=Histomonas meleagridis TaxID=135588 RepID=UPI0035597E4E|nr:cell cycle control protein [Histomonas meleagridis]KAH0797388.1 cell cycle control protein [Histomonas meleagridis]
MSSDSEIEAQSTPVIYSPLPNNRFCQQSLPGIRPFLTPFRAIVLYLIVGIITLALGIFFYINHNDNRPVEVRYDNLCPYTTQNCTVPINIPKRLSGHIQIKYKLTNFYQNHRRFDMSKSEEQLAGSYVSFSSLSNCAPYRSIGDVDNQSLYYLPCGLFPLTVFNDTFTWLSDPSMFSESGIAFSSEKEDLYKNISSEYTAGIRWLDESPLFPGGSTDEHFIVWMRTGALPTIVKPYSHCNDCTIEPGNYSIEIDSNYPTEHFGGYKYIMVVEEKTLRSDENLLGYAYMVCGAVTLAYAIVLGIAELVAPRPLGEKKRKNY